MLKTLRLNNKQSSKIFIQSCNFNTVTCHGNCTESLASRLRITAHPNVFNCCDVKRNIQSISCLTNFAPAVAQERTKYETNTVPKNARVVICGGGVMGGMFVY